MPTAQLPLETILQVVEASLRDDAGDAAATQSHFEQLRLVNKAVKQQAHRSYPEGIADLARRGASVLLDHTPPSEWSTKLEEVAPVLRITTQLAIVRTTAKPHGDLYHELAWTGGVRAMLLMAPQLLELSLNCATDPFILGGLGLQQCSDLQAVRITRSWKDQLDDLDLTSMDALRSFSMTAEEPYVFRKALDFRLPSQLAILELNLLGLTAADVAGIIPRLHCLEKLQVQDDLRDGQVEAMHLPQMKMLRKLDLSDKMEQGALMEIAKCGALEELDLSYSELSSVASLRLLENTTIRILNLSVNDLTDPASLGLAFNKSLVKLNASKNPFNSLLFGLEQNSTLRTLNLNRTHVVAPRMRQLSEQLSHNTTLTTLSLRHCRIDDTELQELHLGQSSGLRSLDLSCNQDITDKGLKPLVESIEKHGLRVKVGLAVTGASKGVKARVAAFA